MVERQEVEALLAEAERGERPITDSRTMAALCRAWLAVDSAPEGTAREVSGLQVTIGRLAEPFRAEAGRVRIVPVERGDERPIGDTPPAPGA